MRFLKTLCVVAALVFVPAQATAQVTIPAQPQVTDLLSSFTQPVMTKTGIAMVPSPIATIASGEVDNQMFEFRVTPEGGLVLKFNVNAVAGAIAVAIACDSDAAKNGMRAGDPILHYGSVTVGAISTHDEFRKAIASEDTKGSEIEVQFTRGIRSVVPIKKVFTIGEPDFSKTVGRHC